MIWLLLCLYKVLSGFIVFMVGTIGAQDWLFYMFIHCIHDTHYLWLRLIILRVYLQYSTSSRQREKNKQR